MAKQSQVKESVGDVGWYQMIPLTHEMVRGRFRIPCFIKCLSCFVQATLESFANPRLIIVSWTHAGMEQRAFLISVDSHASAQKVRTVTPGRGALGFPF